MPIEFLPQPHKVRMQAGRFALPASGTIAVCCQRMLPAARLAQSLLKRHTLATPAAGASDTLTLRVAKGLKPGGYRLRIDKAGITIDADHPDAARDGVRTLLQVARQCPAGRLACMTVEDWPDFADRGVYYDVCRGRVPHTERLAEQAALLADYKVNQYQLYVEHTFAFRGHPLIGKGCGPLTGQDMLDVQDACAAGGVEFVPSLASFGHMARVLSLEPYRELAEDYGVGRYDATDPDAPSWTSHLPHGWTLSPANEKIYPFLDSLYGEFLPLFASGRFNVCCDETWDLGRGQSRKLCQKLGKGRVYLNHIRRLRDLAEKYGKRIMFWGDIILHHPELIPEIPHDAIVLDWGYNYDRDFSTTKKFQAAGLEFYGCPGTNSWVSLFPRLPDAMGNIHNFADAARKTGATGLLNTDWGDGGHYNFMELSWHGYLFGAEQAWNVAADQGSFTRRFCKLFLNSADAGLAKAVDRLGEISHLRYGRFYQSVWQHVFFAAPGDDPLKQTEDGANVARGGKCQYTRMKLDARAGAKALEQIGPVRDTLASAASTRGTDPQGVLPYWVFAADTIAHAARKLSLLGPGARPTAADRRKLRTEMQSLRQRFQKLWLARNRRSEIAITLKRYDRAIRGLR